jgi:hypothetical protein
VAAAAGFAARRVEREARAVLEKVTEWKRTKDSAASSRVVRDVVDADPSLAGHALAHFTANDYRASRYYFRQADMLVLFLLSLLLVFAATPPSVAVAAFKMLASLVLLATFALAFLWVRPFAPGDTWKMPVKVYSLVLAAVASWLNLSNYISPTSSSTRNLSVLVFMMSIGLFLTLVLAFWVVLIRGADREAAVQRAGRKAKGRRGGDSGADPADAAEDDAVVMEPGGNPLLTPRLPRAGATATERALHLTMLVRLATYRDALVRDGRLPTGNPGASDEPLPAPTGDAARQFGPMLGRARSPSARRAADRVAPPSGERDSTVAPATGPAIGRTLSGALRWRELMRTLTPEPRRRAASSASRGRPGTSSRALSSARGVSSGPTRA